MQLQSYTPPKDEVLDFCHHLCKDTDNCYDTLDEIRYYKFNHMLGDILVVVTLSLMAAPPLTNLSKHREPVHHDQISTPMPIGIP